MKGGLEEGQGPNKQEGGGEDWDPLEAGDVGWDPLKAGDEDVLEVGDKDVSRKSLEVGNEDEGVLEAGNKDVSRKSLEVGNEDEGVLEAGAEGVLEAGAEGVGWQFLGPATKTWVGTKWRPMA